MKAFYHVCMTAHSEVLLRNMEDVRMMTNITALAAHRTGACLLTDSEMSTHFHETVLADDIHRFATSQELSLIKAFNYRHSRKGPLFDGKPYTMMLSGPRHMQMAMNYTLRQGLHHGQSETAFSYPWSTCNNLFMEERGLAERKACFKGRSDIRMFLPKNADFPDTWEADADGILLRRSFEELAIVENWYGTARSFILSMTRKTSDEWMEEQKKDDAGDPMVTLFSLESGYSGDDIRNMLRNELNSKYINRGYSDMEICMLIDTQMLGKFGVSSVYQLGIDRKKKIAAELRYDLGIHNEAQISRCLAMNYNR